VKTGTLREGFFTTLVDLDRLAIAYEVGDEHRVVRHRVEARELRSEAADLRERSGEILDRDLIRTRVVEIQPPARVRVENVVVARLGTP
jgi:hypothetical protein